MTNNIKIFDNSLIQINSNFHVAQTIYNNLINENDSLLNENELIKNDIDDLDKVKNILETLKVLKLQEKKDFILNIINTALGDIFQDNIKISIEPKEMTSSNKNTNQKFDIVFYQNNNELARNEELLISNGGGIMQVVSMLFKLLIGYIYSKNTFYMFDESFSQLSSDNRLRLSKFLQMFCKEYKFTLVVVSQVIDLDEYADIIHTVDANYNDKGVRTLQLINTTIKENLIEENIKQENGGIWETKIKNFQSISNIDLVFSGYTIIRGPNNSGKSAILRAINSILYNSFNVKKYPRIVGIDSKGNPTKRKESSEIYLSKKILENNEIVNKEIGLRYKSNKVSFIIENEEYYGKNLAADRLQEKIEELGFKYINLKEFYKNFKGNLKDQTERIATTTQYDGLFIVGSKGNETEKIFNFLFNTENISKAIFKVKEDIELIGKKYDNNIKLIESNKLEITKQFDFSNFFKSSLILSIKFTSTSAIPGFITKSILSNSKVSGSTIGMFSFIFFLSLNSLIFIGSLIYSPFALVDTLILLPAFKIVSRILPAGVSKIS